MDFVNLSSSKIEFLPLGPQAQPGRVPIEVNLIAQSSKIENSFSIAVLFDGNTY